MAGNPDREYAIWVNQDELGKKKEIHLEGKVITFRVPDHIDGHAVLRLKNLGFPDGSQIGNLLVRINLLEKGWTTGGSPFRWARQGSSSGSSPEPLRWMNPSPGQERHSRTRSPFARGDAVKDPMQMRWAGYLITGAGLVLVAGRFLGILPIFAWTGIIIVVAGIYAAFFT